MTLSLTFKTTVMECARCGADHIDIEFSPLDNGGLFSHWTLCPTNGQPVLLFIGKPAKKAAPRAKVIVVGSFDAFWSVYPRKTAKGAAEKAWNNGACGADDVFTLIMAAVQRQRKCEQWTRDDGAFIPHPATWLNGKRWLDEPMKLAVPSVTTAKDWHRHAISVVDRLKGYEGMPPGQELEDVKSWLVSKKAGVAEGGEAAKKYLRENLTVWGLKVIQSAWRDQS